MGTSKRLRALLKKKQGLLLDISLGGTPQPRSTVLGPHGDIRHDPRELPLPLPDQSCHTIVCTHTLEYLDPRDWFDWWDDVWRIMRPHGFVYVSGPYGGDESLGWLSDPTHRTRVIEASFSWFDPRLPFYTMHGQAGRETPKPWITMSVARVPGAHGTFSYNVCLARCEVSEAQTIVTSQQNGSAA